MKLHLKSLLFFFLFFSLLAKGAEKQCSIPAAKQKNIESVVFQNTSSLLAVETNAGTSGILQSLKLTERDFTGSNIIKFNRKQGFHNSVQNFFRYSAAYYRLYHSNRCNKLVSTPLYISIRSIII